MPIFTNHLNDQISFVRQYSTIAHKINELLNIGVCNEIKLFGICGFVKDKRNGQSLIGS